MGSSWRVALVYDGIPAASPREAVEKLIETLGLSGRMWAEARADDDNMTYVVTVNPPRVGVRPLRRGEKGWSNE